MEQTCKDYTKTEHYRPGEPKITKRLVENGIQQEQHMHNTKMKMVIRNNKVIYIEMGGGSAGTIRITVLALVLYGKRSAHANHIDPELNQACREINGCLSIVPLGYIRLLRRANVDSHRGHHFTVSTPCTTLLVG